MLILVISDSRESWQFFSCNSKLVWVLVTFSHLIDRQNFDWIFLVCSWFLSPLTMHVFLELRNMLWQINSKFEHFITYILKISDKKMYFQNTTREIIFLLQLTPTKDYITARSLQYVRRCTNFYTEYMYCRDPYYYTDPMQTNSVQTEPPLLCISSIFFRQRAESISEACPCPTLPYNSTIGNVMSVFF